MNLGIAGNGKIVREFLSVVNQIDDLKVQAICGRPGSADRTKELANRYRIPATYNNYNDFLRDKSFDTVYIAVTNELHYEYAKKALKLGKNCIVEKPFTLTYDQARELFRIANSKDCYIFEAITSIFSKAYSEIQKQLPNLGPIRLVEANYSQYSSRYDDFKEEIIRPAFDVEKGGGALNDLNIYNLHIVIGLFGKPLSAQYFGNIQNGVDTSGVAILRYPGFICALMAAKDSFNDSYFNIQGENKVLIQRTSTNICGPFEIEDKNQEVEYFDGRDYHKHRMVNEFDTFINIIKTNDLNYNEKLEKQTLLVLQVLEELKKNTITQ